MSGDTRDLSWLGGPAPAPPVYPERVVWRVEKNTRWSEARIRQVPHGHELRIVVGDTLFWSCVYHDAESADLGVASTGVLQDFVRLGWAVPVTAPTDASA